MDLTFLSAGEALCKTFPAENKWPSTINKKIKVNTKPQSQPPVNLTAMETTTATFPRILHEPSHHLRSQRNEVFHDKCGIVWII